MAPQRPQSVTLSAPTRRGVLLIHGFTGSPSEFADFPLLLQEAGFNVSVPLLPGHGTVSSELDRTDKTQWVEAAEAAYLDLAGRCDEIFVIGLSMGGLLGLHLAHRHPEIRALVCLAAPFWLRNPRVHRGMTFLDRLHLWSLYPHKIIRKSGTPSPTEAELGRFAYTEYPVKALRSLVQLVNDTKKLLPQVRVPVLLVHSKADPLIPFQSMARIAALLPQKPETMTLEEFGHVIPCHPKRRRVFSEVISFFNRHSRQI